MTTLRFVTNSEQKQGVVWDAYPSWAQFSWLIFFSALSGLRSALLFHFGVEGWEVWMLGAVLLIICVAILRRWAHYQLTREQIIVRNGYTGHQIHSVPLTDVREITVQQGIVAGFFGIGTLTISSCTTDILVSLRGICNPEEVKIRIEASAWRRGRTPVNSPASR